jgi:WD40 repeat protein
MGNGPGKPNKNKDKDVLLQTCEDHEGSINCMEVSEDGSVLVTGSDDSNLRLWSTKTETIECIGVLEGHEDYITSILIEDSFVLSSSADKTIKKWDMYSCECLLTYLGHESTVNKLVCTGDFLFSVSYDKKARCWDFDTGECVRVFSGHKNNVTSILFIPADKDNLNDAMSFIQQHAAKSKGNLQVPNMRSKQEEDEDDVYKRDLIITGSLDSLAKSWSIETGECIQSFKGHTAAITCLATDPFGKLLFSGSADHTIRSWEIMTGQALKVFAGHQTTVISLLVNSHSFLLFKSNLKMKGSNYSIL